MSFSDAAVFCYSNPFCIILLIISHSFSDNTSFCYHIKNVISAVRAYIKGNKVVKCIVCAVLCYYCKGFAAFCKFICCTLQNVFSAVCNFTGSIFSRESCRAYLTVCGRSFKGINTLYPAADFRTETVIDTVLSVFKQYSYIIMLVFVIIINDIVRKFKVNFIKFPDYS